MAAARSANARLAVAVIARAVMPLHGIGGLERSVHDLVRHLAARNVDVTLIVPPPTQPVENPFDAARVRVHHVPYRTFPFANRRGTTILDRATAYPLYGRRAGRVALELARAGEIDLIHGFGASLLGAATGPRLVPLVLNPQGLEEFGATTDRPPRLKHLGYAPLRRAVRRTAAAADRIIATDRALEPVLERHLHPRAGQIVVIPNGIDLATIDAIAVDGHAMRRRHGVADDEMVLLSVGRLEFNKGFDVLAQALGRAAQAFGTRPWRWAIVGSGPYRTAIEAAVRDAGIGARVLFAGRASDDDLHAWYDAASFFVHPTRYEGSSLVTLEAMAHRRAVVATRAGGLPDKVRPGVNGWLVEPGDAAPLAAALIDAASSSRLAEMGDASRAIVAREFDWPVIADQHISMYRKLLDR